MASLKRTISAFFFKQRNLQLRGISDRSFARITESFLDITDIVGAIHCQPLSPRTQLSDLRTRLLVTNLMFDVAPDAIKATISVNK